MPSYITGLCCFLLCRAGDAASADFVNLYSVLFLPGGFENLTYKEDGKDGYYWASDCTDETTSRFFTFYNDNILDTGSASKELKFSIRLMKSR